MAFVYMYRYVLGGCRLEIGVEDRCMEPSFCIIVRGYRGSIVFCILDYSSIVQLLGKLPYMFRLQINDTTEIAPIQLSLSSVTSQAPKRPKKVIFPARHSL